MVSARTKSEEMFAEASERIIYGSEIMGKAADEYSDRARDFVSLAPVQRVTYFGFLITTIGVSLAVFSAFSPTAEFDSPVTITLLVIGASIILIGAVGEASVSFILARTALRKAEQLENDAKAEQARGLAQLSSIFGKKQE